MQIVVQAILAQLALGLPERERRLLTEALALLDREAFEQWCLGEIARAHASGQPVGFGLPRDAD